jgi:hypothetical protein
MINHTCEVARPKAIVNINHRNAAGARIEHGQKGCNSVERGTISHAGWYRNDRTISQSSHYAGERFFHPGNSDNDAGAHYFVQKSKCPMKSRHTHIIKPNDLVTQRFSRERSLLRDRDIAGAAGGYDDIAEAVGSGKLSHDTYSCLPMIGNGIFPQLRRKLPEPNE